MYPGIIQQENLANTEEQLRRLLFGKGQEGVWFDPSDLSTMFQDAAGRIPVTTDGDPIGLILDKHSKDFRGIVNLVTDSENFSDTSDWVTPESFTLEEVNSILGSPAVAWRHTNTGVASSRSRRQPNLVPTSEAKSYFFQVVVEQGSSDTIVIGIRDDIAANWVAAYRYNFTTDSITLFSNGVGVNTQASFVVQTETPNGGKTVEFRVEGEPVNVGNQLGVYIYPTDTTTNTDDTIIHWVQFSDKGYEPYQKKTDTLAVEGNHATASSPANFTYRTDGTLHWIEHPGSGVMSFTPAPSTGTSDVCRFGAQFRLTDPATTWGCLTSWSDISSGGFVILSQMDSIATNITQPTFNQMGPNRVNGTDFTGTRGDLYNELVSAPKVIGAVGLDLVTDDGHTVQFTGRYGTQAHSGTNCYGFIEYRGNLSQGVYEFVEQYLADKAGITLP